ncbi:MAG: stage IV sporulation protein A [Clostridiales bacterium]|nr:stage IV sporulation protein A [Clostridiales bacterium]
MEETNIYRDIARRNNGDVYIGVVGPVRTGKSTFIKRFMDTLVIPNMTNVYQAERTRDELPQSAAGRTIMTTEPKFIPNEAIEINLGDNASMRVRMIDCVGYIVDESLGYQEDGEPRMVNTPWFDHPIPFNDAAELGTKKVICDHSTIGLVITTDASFSEIPRDAYVDAEKRVIAELKAINKPFIVLLNSQEPTSSQAKQLASQLEAEYDVSVMPVNCEELKGEDINAILNKILMEFPLYEIEIKIPCWLKRLDSNHELVKSVYETVIDATQDAANLRDVDKVATRLSKPDFIKKANADNIDLGTGAVKIELELTDGMFYKVLSECSGTKIGNDEELLEELKELSKMKKEYEHIKDALECVRATGYGVVSPRSDEMVLDEPKIIKQGGRYGIKLKACAPSIHMMRADIETAVSPIVGTIKQSEELVEHLLAEYEEDPKKLWESNIFGKTLNELVNDGLKNKLDRMPEEAQAKLRETLERIINEGSGGLLCLIL